MAATISQGHCTPARYVCVKIPASLGFRTSERGILCVKPSDGESSQAFCIPQHTLGVNPEVLSDGFTA